MDISLIRATKEDARLFVHIHNASFYDDFLKYGFCPGYGRSLESLEDGIKRYYTYKIIADNTAVGKISVDRCLENVYHITCLCVVPQYQNQGIGKKALALIENMYSDSRCWILETPADNPRNVAFYTSCGYTISGQSYDGIDLVILSKSTGPTND